MLYSCFNQQCASLWPNVQHHLHHPPNHRSSSLIGTTHKCYRSIWVLLLLCRWETKAATSRCESCKRDVAQEASSAVAMGARLMGLAGSQSGAGRGPPLRIFLYKDVWWMWQRHHERMSFSAPGPESVQRPENPTGCTGWARWGWRYTSGWSRGAYTNRSACCSIIWVDDWQKKKSWWERFGLHQTELRGQEVQSEYAWEEWNSL